jgi:hypothetical protein
VSAKYPDTELQDAMADTIATLTAERDRLKAQAKFLQSERPLARRAARLEEALRDAAKRLLGAGMLGGPEDPVVSALAQEDKP